ncbi:hypothetical protein [Maribacter algicola]|uniref:hypothetical protein n=1 Tax=Maribacter algicola TaxID=2498892 RepID=UPI001403E845|nr:hypothetical protein [Maribacter algicola]
MKSFQRPTQHTDSKHLFFQRPVVRSAKELGKDVYHIFGYQETQNTFKGQHQYSFKASR